MVFITTTEAQIKKPETEDMGQTYKKLLPKGLETRFQIDIEQVMKHLRNKIFGQSAALTAIEDMLKIVKADVGEPDTPLYIAMFLGPTGVGKTETIKILAEAIHGSHEALCRVDMNTLALDHYAAALTGAPPGYVGSKEGATILDKEKIEGSFSKPGIILFDEIEKASPQVIQTLLNIFDNGIMNMASGEQKNKLQKYDYFYDQ
ncbi:MAG: AAA family ATPase [Bacillota bacterium]